MLLFLLFSQSISEFIHGDDVPELAVRLHDLWHTRHLIEPREQIRQCLALNALSMQSKHTHYLVVDD